MVMELTGGLGSTSPSRRSACRVVRACTSIVRPGGRVANVGVHSHSAAPPETLDRNITITTGLVDDHDRPVDEADPGRRLIRRRSQRTTSRQRRRDRYDVPRRRSETHALKVVLTAEPVPALPATIAAPSKQSRRGSDRPSRGGRADR